MAFPASVVAAAAQIGVDVNSLGQQEVELLKQILATLVAIDQIASGSGITQLTGDGTAGPGSGSQALTVTKSNGVPFASGAFATAISPGGSSGQVQYNNGGTAFGGVTGMTLTAGALTAINFTGNVTCTALFPTGGDTTFGGAASILQTTAAGATGMKLYGRFDGSNFVVEVDDGNSNQMFNWCTSMFTIFPSALNFAGLTNTPGATVQTGFVTINVAGTPTKFLTG